MLSTYRKTMKTWNLKEKQLQGQTDCFHRNQPLLLSLEILRTNRKRFPETSRNENCSLGVSKTRLAGWWFGTLFTFPYIRNSHPNWIICFRGFGNHQPEVFFFNQNWNDWSRWLILCGCLWHDVGYFHKTASISFQFFFWATKNQGGHASFDVFGHLFD